jgi:hypothetical protein
MDSEKKLVFTDIADLVKELAPGSGEASASARFLQTVTPEETGAPVCLHRHADAGGSSGGGSGYDLSALYENWRSWTASDALNVQLT